MDDNVLAVGFFFVFPFRRDEIEELLGRFQVALLHVVIVKVGVERCFTKVVKAGFAVVRFERGVPFDQSKYMMERTFVNEPCPRGFAFYMGAVWNGHLIDL